jgi:hypothetical protein
LVRSQIVLKTAKLDLSNQLKEQNKEETKKKYFKNKFFEQKLAHLLADRVLAKRQNIVNAQIVF